MKKIILGVLCLCLGAAVAEARYIDYPGGWQVMQMNDDENNSVHVFYTVTPYASVGYALDYWREDEWVMNAAQGALLLKRWNLPNAQANLVLHGGVGVATSDHREFDNETEPGGFAGIAFDIEDRRLYASYENHYVEAGDIYGAFEQSGRVGFAPYVADYGALHTWIMLQVDHRPEDDDKVVFTPMLRFFQGDIMVEIGITDTEKLLLNTMIRF